MSNRVCHVMLFKEYDKGLPIIQATWLTPLEPIPVFTAWSQPEILLLLLYGMMVFFSGVLIPACTPGWKGNLKYLTLLFEKPHNDFGYSLIHILFNAVSEDAGQPGFSHLNI